MTSGNEKNTASSINERIKDIIRFSYTKDELFQALLSLVSTMGSVNLPCSVRLSLHCSCCSPSRS